MNKIKNLSLLVVDDEKNIRAFLKTSLSAYGYKVFEAASGTEALEKITKNHPDVVILDLGLPDFDGIEVVKRIRKHSTIPIIILSIRDEAQDKINALDAGADDYLIKPFLIGELLARIRAVIRRLLPVSTEEVLNIGSLCIDITKHRVTKQNKIISLSPTEYALLKLLIINIGKVVMHQHILREVWDKTDDYEGILHLLRVTISNLRNKIEPDPDRPRYILTEPGIGYRFSENM
jgi:two-component system, OmpR family, KDP operon response regulator KdpE